MTTGGWIFLALGWGGVAALCAFCLARSLREAARRGDRPRE